MARIVQPNMQARVTQAVGDAQLQHCSLVRRPVCRHALCCKNKRCQHSHAPLSSIFLSKLMRQCRWVSVERIQTQFKRATRLPPRISAVSESLGIDYNRQPQYWRASTSLCFDHIYVAGPEASSSDLRPSALVSSRDSTARGAT